MANYDVIGNIVIVKFSRGEKTARKKDWAGKFLKEHKNVKTVLEKSDKIKGRLRIGKSKFILGERTKEALYRENGCEFRLNVDTCYFSPRLASDRLEIAKKVRRGEKVLVMFSGVGVYGIVIGKNSEASRIVCVELGREPSRYATENVRRNKVDVEVVQGDVRKVLSARKLDARFCGGRLNNNARASRSFDILRTRTSARSVRKIKFDRIVMARPNLKDTFLNVAFSIVKKGGVIHYHGFYSECDKDKMISEIKSEASRARKKIKIQGVKKIGEIGVRKFRWRVD